MDLGPRGAAIRSAQRPMLQFDQRDVSNLVPDFWTSIPLRELAVAVPAAAVAAATAAATATTATAAATTAAAAVAAATAAATTAAAAATAATAALTLTRFAHAKGAAAEVTSIQLRDRRLRVLRRGHLNESKPARLPRHTVRNDLHLGDLTTTLLERCPQSRFIGIKGKVPYVQPLSSHR